MLKTTFPDNPAKTTAYRDVLTEKELLGMFKKWAEDEDVWDQSQYFYPPEPFFYPSGLFFSHLLHELAADFESVEKEHNAFQLTLTDLEKWATQYIWIWTAIWRACVRRLTRTSLRHEYFGGQQALIQYLHLV